MDKDNIIWKNKSFKPLIRGKKKICGRGRSGKILVERRGGGIKRLYRIIDYYRFIWNIPGYISRMEYNPGKFSLLFFIVYPNGICSYNLAVQGLGYGDIIENGSNMVGSCTYLNQIPRNTYINQVEIRPYCGGRLCRSRGGFAKLESFIEDICIIRVRSGVRFFLSKWCTAVIGVLFLLPTKERLKNAGANRRLGRRPTVRGVAKNPVDHPLGGGEGRSSGGRFAVNFRGVLAKGFKTINRKIRYV